MTDHVICHKCGILLECKMTEVSINPESECSDKRIDSEHIPSYEKCNCLNKPSGNVRFKIKICKIILTEIHKAMIHAPMTKGQVYSQAIYPLNLLIGDLKAKQRYFEAQGQ